MVSATRYKKLTIKLFKLLHSDFVSDVLLGSTNYTTSLDIWGVGCIFVEMLNGCPCFPGVRDVFDQLDKIFRVVGTPTEEVFIFSFKFERMRSRNPVGFQFQMWPGVSRLPNYRPHKLSFYRSQRLSYVWPILYDVPFAENLANLLLQQRANRRIGADQALNHRYFSDLPPKIFELSDGKKASSEINNFIYFVNISYSSRGVRLFSSRC